MASRSVSSTLVSKACITFGLNRLRIGAEVLETRCSIGKDDDGNDDNNDDDERHVKSGI
ncbi:MAG: hypothetical protein QXI92_03865 [Candidatus Nitrosocaldus sp.]